MLVDLYRSMSQRIRNGNKTIALLKSPQRIPGTWYWYIHKRYWYNPAEEGSWQVLVYCRAAVDAVTPRAMWAEMYSCKP